MIVDKMLAKARFDRDTLPLLQSSDHYYGAGIRVITVEFPILISTLWWKKYQREIRLKILADDYNYLPIQGYWIDDNGHPLLKGRGLVPHGLGFQTEGGQPYGLQRTWFCFRGWREYHDHQSHQNIPWASIRQNTQYRIPALMLQLNSDLNRVEVNAA